MAAFFLWVAGYACGIVRWKRLLQAEAIPWSWQTVAHLSLRGAFFSTFLPGGVGGDIYRIGVADKKDLPTIAWTVWADRWSGILGLGFLVALALPWIDGALLRTLQLDRAGLALGLALVLGTALTFFAQRYFKKTIPVNEWLQAVGWSMVSHSCNAAALWIFVLTWASPYAAWMPLFLLLTSVPQLLPAGVGTGHWVAVRMFAFAGVAEVDSSQLYSLYAAGLLFWGVVGAALFLRRRKHSL